MKTQSTLLQQLRDSLSAEKFDRLQRAFEMIQAGYPNATLEPMTLPVYIQDLADLPIECLEEAIPLIRRKYAFFPTVAEIYAEVGDLHAKRVQEHKEQQDREARLLREAPGEPMPEDIKAKLKASLTSMSLNNGKQRKAKKIMVEEEW